MWSRLLTEPGRVTGRWFRSSYVLVVATRGGATCSPAERSRELASGYLARRTGLSVPVGDLILGHMGVIEFELERTIKAPIEAVFSRLADINGYNEWMPEKGSILRHTHQTSPGEPAEGTTFLDRTTYGPTPGEIMEFRAPHTLVYHWWDSSETGEPKAEGWPGYSLERGRTTTRRWFGTTRRCTRTVSIVSRRRCSAGSP